MAPPDIADVSRPTTAIAVFARAPVPGQVKTRLIPRLGAQGAAALQTVLIGRAVRTALAAGVGPVSLWCSPNCEHPAFISCADALGVPLFTQHGGDLGARMLAAFAHLCRGSQVILIGSDCPALTSRDIRAAADALAQDHDAVVIPAEDGGYVLLGLRRPVASLFTAMPWGASAVMAETRLRFRHEGLRWQELPVSWDVDRSGDYDRLEASGLMRDETERLDNRVAKQ
jgi:rSAM/selenodomain-associated transferase 1